MRITNLLFLSIFIGCSPVVGQTNFLPGYYVTGKGDTIRGLIEYRAPEKMGYMIRFKEITESRPIALLPEHVKAVVIQDKNFFESYSYTPLNGDSFFGFFKKKITGRLSLYTYRGKFFVMKAGDELREVTKKRKNITPTLIANDYSGLGIFRLLIADCQSMDEEFIIRNYVNDLDYEKIVITYNDCFPEESFVHEDIKIPQHLDFGLHGSLNASRPNFSKTRIAPNARFNWTASATGGMFLSLFTRRTGDNLRLVLEPSFGLYKGYSYFEDPPEANDVFLKYSFVRVPILMRFFHNNIFAQAGFTNLFILKQENNWRREVLENNFIVTTSSGPSYNIRSSILGGTFGVGLRTQIGTMPLLTSIGISNIFRHRSNSTHEQPDVMWCDLNVALQLTRK